MSISYRNTNPSPGDSTNVLLAKLLQVFGGTPASEDSENTLLSQILSIANDGGSGSGLPAGAKVFRALLTQTGTNAPVATILENTLGGVPVWTRPFGAGVYHMTLTGVFTASKTFVMIQSCLDAANTHVASARRGSNDLILVQTADTSGAGTDGLLVGDSIEIIVYP